jgi:CBS domain-containing protein
MKCQEVMTANPACCTPGDTAARIASLMKEENVGSIPVCEDGHSRRVVGIVTDRDLALKVVAEGRAPEGTPAEQVMTRRPITCGVEDELDDAIEAMEQHQIRRILVVDREGRLKGIIAQADVAIRNDDPEQTAEAVRHISEPGRRRAARA